MPNPNIESLLILQERDARRLDLEKQIAAIPGEISRLEEKIEAEKKTLEESKGRIRELEVKRKDLESEVAAAEAQIARYRNQQLEVKKNDEYQALTKEIETTQAKVGELEEAVIQVLFELDEERQRVTEIEKDFQDVIGKLEGKIEDRKARKIGLEEELKQKRMEAEEARKRVPDPEYLSAYDRQARVVKFPIVAAVVDRSCQGCFLRVSGGVDIDVRAGDKIVTCDNCGRILYSSR